MLVERSGIQVRQTLNASLVFEHGLGFTREGSFQRTEYTSYFSQVDKHRQSNIINNIIPTYGTRQYTSSRCHCLVNSSHVVVAVLDGHPMGREGRRRPAKLSQYC